MRLESLHRRGGWLGWVLLPLLPLELLYRLAMRLRLLLYGGGILRSEGVRIPVVSVGNITWGGAGKTPIVIHLAKLLQDRGLRVAVLSQGYGGTGQGHRIVSLGEGLLTDAEDVGDEPILIARRCPGVQVLVGPSRVELARIAQERLGAGVAILDDGFQHLALKRDLDLVVLDGASPFGNGRLIPRGPLREPPSHLARADLAWISKVGEGSARAIEEAERAIAKGIGKDPIRSRYRVSGVFRGDLQTPVPKEEWEGAAVFLLAALARPASFRRTVEGMGCEVVGEGFFRDHHFFSEEELSEVFQTAEGRGASFVLTTEKDAVRLPPRWAGDGRLAVVRIEVEVLEGEHLLDEALDGLVRLQRERVA